MYIANNKVTEFKDKVMNCLYDKNYKSNGLNTALVSLNYETEIIDFLEIKDFDLIEKQIDVMIGTNNFQNLEYFIPLIGCKYKNICFYTSELINKLFVSNFKNEFIECIAKKYLIFKKVFEVQSFENFIFYFYDFFEEKEILLKSIELNDNKKIFEILKKFIKCNKDVKIYFNKRQISILKNQTENNFFNIDSEDFSIQPCFKYLFTKKYYKAFMDCLEI
ncbi:hypothetical protein GVAV_001082 [Gurleya vavrai]